ncbi:MAG: hypothetical protein ACLFUW_09025 [Bacteroidales bacterium]
MFLKLLLPAIILVGISGLFLGIKMIIQKNGKFPETEIGRNKEMRKRGIICAKAEEIRCRNEIKKQGKIDHICNSCHL